MRTILLVLGLVFLVSWWLLRRRASAPATARTRRPERRQIDSSSEFHAGSIKPQPYACEAARELEGVRILAADAPKLPLPDCNREACECRFQHFNDRRTGQDRRSPFGARGRLVGTGTFEQERRQRDGRRADD
jgi:hypothetical protein